MPRIQNQQSIDVREHSPVNDSRTCSQPNARDMLDAKAKVVDSHPLLPPKMHIGGLTNLRGAQDNESG